MSVYIQSGAMLSFSASGKDDAYLQSPFMWQSSRSNVTANLCWQNFHQAQKSKLIGQTVTLDGSEDLIPLLCAEV